MAVLGRRGHHPDPARLRAHLRPAGTGPALLRPERPDPAEDEAQRELLRLSIRSLGIASERCLRDYFRLLPQDAKARIPELVEAGDLVPVAVEGWSGPVYLDPGARLPRRIEAQALVSPFDPIVWERTRTERLFGFRYRIEIYTPAEKREFGYYCLPFLLGDRIVARLDLKADRAGGRLVVHSIHPEASVAPDEIAPALRRRASPHGPLARPRRYRGAGGLAEAASGFLKADSARPPRRAPAARRIGAG
jgi:uncharacterized protein YcaQ